MSIKTRSLGTLSSAARGILITAGVAANPWIATLTAGHRQKNGDRIAIVGLTTFTTIPNGEFTLSALAATAGTIDGSAVGTYGGTAVVAALMDKTPFQAKHSAAFIAGDQGQAAIFVGTVVVEAADSADFASAGGFYYTNTSGVATAGFKSALMSGEIAIPAQDTVGGGSNIVEVTLSRYMTLRCSAYTTGTYHGSLLA